MSLTAISYEFYFSLFVGSQKHKGTGLTQIEDSEGFIIINQILKFRNAHQMWTDEDLVTLAKLIKKIPGGSSDRLEQNS